LGYITVLLYWFINNLEEVNVHGMHVECMLCMGMRLH